MNSAEFQRYAALVNQGPGKPSFLLHPLHAEFVSFGEDARALLIAVVELSLETDGSAASAARAIKMEVLAKAMFLKARSVARQQLGKAKQS
ncbi:MAG: hypothetical protein ACR2NX_04265 [Chthoniobacterales bacterium]